MYDSLFITGKKAAKMVAQGALLFDTRSPVQFRDGSLPGATNISPRTVSMLTKYPKTTKLVFFGDIIETTTIINYATQMGYANVYTFGSMVDWGK